MLQSLWDSVLLVHGHPCVNRDPKHAPCIYTTTSLVSPSPRQEAKEIRRNSPSDLAMVAKYLLGFRDLEGKVVTFKAIKPAAKLVRRVIKFKHYGVFRGGFAVH